MDWIDGDGSVNAARFAAELDRHRGRLKGLIHLRLEPRMRARVDASDVIQETFVEATRRASEFGAKQEVPFYVWLRFLAVQKLAQLHRHHLGAQKRDARRETPLRGWVGPDASSIAIAQSLAGDGPTPSEHLMAAEQRAQVLASLESLKPEDREILALRHVEGLSNRECAHVLEIKETAASQRYVRAARRFGAALKERGGPGFPPPTGQSASAG
ncbi:MAG: sigma-70 family RNA polymerase sigma factor [Planctomycetota bacterium]